MRDKTGISFKPPLPAVRSTHDFRMWLLDWIGIQRDNVLQVIFTVIYQLWQARNNACESQCIEDPVAIVTRSIALVLEWQSLQEERQPTAPTRSKRWHPPAEGWIKANANGAFVASDGNGGGGVVLRDHHGDFRGGACHFFSFVSDPECAELLACRRAVNLAKEIGITKLALETDSTAVAAKLPSMERDRSVHGPLVEEVKALLGEFQEITVKAVRRSANEVAHKLAKYGCVNQQCTTWLRFPPNCIVDVLETDCIPEEF